MEQDEVYLIPHFHYDVAYDNTYQAYLEIAFANLIEMLNIMGKYPEYRFLIEQVIMLREFWNRFPEQRARLRQLAGEGRIEVSPGMYVMPDMNLINGESLISQVETGRKWLEDNLGIVPQTCWIADCWGHHSQLPQVLKKCGYKYYAFSRAMRLDLTKKSEFFWQGIDGTTILTHWMPAAYNAIVFPGSTYLPREEEIAGYETNGMSTEEFLFKKLSEVLHKLSRHASGQIMLLPNGSDFTRPQLDSLRLVKEWNNRYPNKKIKISLPREAFHIWEKKSNDIPTIQADFNPLFQGTYCSRIDIKQMNRFLENQIDVAEKLLACIPTIETTKVSGITHQIEETVELMLYNQFHDIICGSIIDEAYEDTLNKHQRAKGLIKNTIDLSLDKFMKANSSANKLNLLVFNSVAKKRKDMVFTHLSFSEDGIKGIRITDKNEMEVPVQILDRKSVLRQDKSHYTEFSFVLPVEIPALGYTNYRIELITHENKVYRTSLKAKDKTIENQFYRLEISDSGTIKSLIHKESNQEFVDPDRPYFNDLVFQIDQGDFWEYYQVPADDMRTVRHYSDPYPIGDRRAVFAHQRPQQVEIMESGPLRLTVRIKGKVNFWATTWDYLQYIYLYNQIPRIDFRTEFIPVGRQYRVRVCFPTNINKGKIRYEIPFGIEERSEGEYPSLNWIDYRDNTKGICLINKGIPGNNITDGVMMLSLFRAVDMGPGKHECQTGYATGKRQVFDYSLIPFVGKDKEYSPWLYGLIFNQSLITRTGELKEGLAREKSFFSLCPDNVILSRVRRFREGLLVRLYEAAGKKAEFALTVLPDFSHAYETNCLGENPLQWKLSKNKLKGTINPFEIKTFWLKR